LSNEKKPVSETLQSIWSWFSWAEKGGRNVTPAHKTYLQDTVYFDVCSALLRRRTLGVEHANSTRELDAALIWFRRALETTAFFIKADSPETERLLPLICNADATLWRAYDAPITRAEITGWVDELAVNGPKHGVSASAIVDVSFNGVIPPHCTRAGHPVPPLKFDENHFSTTLCVGDAFDNYVPELNVWTRAVVVERMPGYSEFKVERPALFSLPPIRIDISQTQAHARDDAGDDGVNKCGEASFSEKPLAVVWLSDADEKFQCLIAPLGTQNIAASAEYFGSLAAPAASCPLNSALETSRPQLTTSPSARIPAPFSDLIPFSSSSDDMAWRATLKPGDVVDLRSMDGKWAQAVVLAVEGERDSAAAASEQDAALSGWLRLTFVGAPSSAADEIVARASRRLMPLNFVSGGARGPVFVSPMLETDAERTPRWPDDEDSTPTGKLLSAPPGGSVSSAPMGSRLLNILNEFLMLYFDENHVRVHVFADALARIELRAEDYSRPTWTWVASWTAAFGRLAECWTPEGRREFAGPWLRAVIRWVSSALTDDDVRAVTRESLDAFFLGLARLERATRVMQLENEDPAAAACRISEGVALSLASALLCSESVLQRREGLRAINDWIAAARLAEAHGQSGIDSSGRSRLIVARWVTLPITAAVLSGAEALRLAGLYSPPSASAPRTRRSLSFIRDAFVTRHFGDLVRHAGAVLTLLSHVSVASLPINCLPQAELEFLQSASDVCLSPAALADVWAAAAMSSEEDVRDAVAMISEAAAALTPRAALSLLQLALSSGGTRFPVHTARLLGAFATAHAGLVSGTPPSGLETGHAELALAQELTSRAIAALFIASFGGDVCSVAATVSAASVVVHGNAAISSSHAAALAEAALPVLIAVMKKSALASMRMAVLRATTRLVVRGVAVSRALSLLHGVLSAYPLAPATATPVAANSLPKDADSSVAAVISSVAAALPDKKKSSAKMKNTATTEASREAKKRATALRVMQVLRSTPQFAAALGNASGPIASTDSVPMAADTSEQSSEPLAGIFVSEVLCDLNERLFLIPSLLAYAAAVSRAARRVFTNIFGVKTWAEASDDSTGAAGVDELAAECEIFIEERDWAGLQKFQVESRSEEPPDSLLDLLLAAAVRGTPNKAPEPFLVSIRSALSFLGWSLAASDSLALDSEPILQLWDETVECAISARARSSALAWFSAGAAALAPMSSTDGEGLRTDGSTLPALGARGIIFTALAASDLFSARLANPLSKFAARLDHAAFVTWRCFFLLKNSQSGQLLFSSESPLASIGARAGSPTETAQAIAAFNLPKPRQIPISSSAAGTHGLTVAAENFKNLVGNDFLWLAAFEAEDAAASADAVHLLTLISRGVPGNESRVLRETFFERALTCLRYKVAPESNSLSDAGSSKRTDLAACRAIELLTAAVDDGEDEYSRALDKLRILVAVAASVSRAAPPSPGSRAANNLYAAVSIGRARLAASAGLTGGESFLASTAKAQVDSSRCFVLALNGPIEWLRQTPSDRDSSAGEAAASYAVSSTASINATAAVNNDSIPVPSEELDDNPMPSLVPWLPTPSSTADWPCPKCTLANEAGVSACAACGEAWKPPSSSLESVNESPLVPAASKASIASSAWVKSGNLHVSLGASEPLRDLRSAIACAVSAGASYSPLFFDAVPPVSSFPPLAFVANVAPVFTLPSLPSGLAGAALASSAVTVGLRDQFSMRLRPATVAPSENLVLPAFTPSSISAAIVEAIATVDATPAGVLARARDLLLDLVDVAEAASTTGSAILAARTWALFCRLPAPLASSNDWGSILSPSSPARMLATVLSYRKALIEAPAGSGATCSDSICAPLVARANAAAIPLRGSREPLAALRALDTKIRAMWDARAVKDSQRAADAEADESQTSIQDGGCGLAVIDDAAVADAASSWRALFISKGGLEAAVSALHWAVAATATTSLQEPRRTLAAIIISLVDLCSRVCVDAAVNASEISLQPVLDVPAPSLASVPWLWAAPRQLSDRYKLGPLPAGAAALAHVCRPSLITALAELLSRTSEINADIGGSALPALYAWGFLVISTGRAAGEGTAPLLSSLLREDAHRAAGLAGLSAAAAVVALTISRIECAPVWLRLLTVPLVYPEHKGGPHIAALLEIAVREQLASLPREARPGRLARVTLPSCLETLMQEAALLIISPRPRCETAIGAARAAAEIFPGPAAGRSQRSSIFWERAERATENVSIQGPAVAVSAQGPVPVDADPTGPSDPPDEDALLKAALEMSLSDRSQNTSEAPASLYPADANLANEPFENPLLFAKGVLLAIRSAQLVAARDASSMTARMHGSWATLGLERTIEQQAADAAATSSMLSASPLVPAHTMTSPRGTTSPEHSARERDMTLLSVSGVAQSFPIAPFLPASHVTLDGGGRAVAEEVIGGIFGVDEELAAALRLVAALAEVDPRAATRVATGKRLIAAIFEGCLFGPSPRALTPLTRRAAYDALRALTRRSVVNSSKLARVAAAHFGAALEKPHGIAATPLASSASWPSSSLRGAEARGPSGYAGIMNLGSICYQNALLQQFFAVDALHDLVLRLRAVCEATPLGSERAAARRNDAFYQLQRLFVGLDMTPRRAVNPAGWAATVRDASGARVGVRVQQDAEEFLDKVVDLLECAARRDAREAETLRQSLIMRRCGVLACTGGCGRVRLQAPEPCSRLIVPVAAGSLSAAVSAASGWEDVPGVDCEACGSRQPMRKAAPLIDVPDCVVVHIGRFSMDWGTGHATKSNARFEFPHLFDLWPSSLDALVQADDLRTADGRPLSEAAEGNSGRTTSDRSAWRYRLAGIVMHSGSLEAGHYYSYIRERGPRGASVAAARAASGYRGSAPISNGTNAPDIWHEFNDSQVTPWDSSSLESMCFGGSASSSKSAYILFYERENMHALPQVPLAREIAPPHHLRAQQMDKERFEFHERLEDGDAALLFVGLADSLARMPPVLGPECLSSLLVSDGAARLDDDVDDDSVRPEPLDPRSLLRAIAAYALTILPRLRCAASLAAPLHYALSRLVAVRADAAELLIDDVMTAEARLDSFDRLVSARDEILFSARKANPDDDCAYVDGDGGDGDGETAVNTLPVLEPVSPLTGLHVYETYCGLGSQSETQLSWLRLCLMYGPNNGGPSFSVPARYSAARLVTSAIVSLAANGGLQIATAALRLLLSPKILRASGCQYRFHDSLFSAVYDALRGGFGCGLSFFIAAHWVDDDDSKSFHNESAAWACGDVAVVSSAAVATAGPARTLCETSWALRAALLAAGEDFIALLTDYYCRTMPKGYRAASSPLKLAGVARSRMVKSSPLDLPKWTRLLDTLALLITSSATGRMSTLEKFWPASKMPPSLTLAGPISSLRREFPCITLLNFFIHRTHHRPTNTPLTSRKMRLIFLPRLLATQTTSAMPLRLTAILLPRQQPLLQLLTPCLPGFVMTFALRRFQRPPSLCRGCQIGLMQVPPCPSLRTTLSRRPLSSKQLHAPRYRSRCKRLACAARLLTCTGGCLSFQRKWAP
jgi:ubiquitin C-terminal hydrolase